MNRLILGIFIFSLMGGGMAFAEPSVFLNDVDITGVKGQKFTDVTVEIDGKGDIHLIAPQYHIVDTTPGNHATRGRVVDGPKVETLPAGDAPIYLVASFNKPGLLGYNIQVYLNGEFVQTISQGKPQDYVDLSAYLKQGVNRIEYRLVMAADSGTSYRAEADIFLTQMKREANDSMTFTGQYSRVLIRSAAGAKNYVAEFIVP